MCQLPVVRVILKSYLDHDSCLKIREKISGIKGVLSANFNEKANEIRVTYAGGHVRPKILKVEGVIGLRDFL